MTTKHTAGPWSWWPDCVRDGGMITRDGHGQHIAAPTLYFNREETAANARLMAAAPALLAIAQRVTEWERKYPAHRIYSESQTRTIAAEMTAIVKDADAAIAKATGDQA